MIKRICMYTWTIEHTGLRGSSLPSSLGPWALSATFLIAGQLTPRVSVRALGASSNLTLPLTSLVHLPRTVQRPVEGLHLSRVHQTCGKDPA